MNASNFRFYLICSGVILLMASCGNSDSGADSSNPGQDSAAAAAPSLEDKRDRSGIDETSAYAELDAHSALHKMDGISIFRSVVDSSEILQRIVSKKKPIYLFVPSDAALAGATGALQKAIQDTTSDVLVKLLGYSHIFYPTDQNTDNARTIRSLTGKDLSMVKEGNEWKVQGIPVNGGVIKTQNAQIYRIDQILQ